MLQSLVPVIVDCALTVTLCALHAYAKATNQVTREWSKIKRYAEKHPRRQRCVTGDQLSTFCGRLVLVSKSALRNFLITLNVIESIPLF